jgi:hypothetical protein
LSEVVLALNPHDHAYPGILGTKPSTTVSAMMSATFCVATMLATGTITRAQLRSPGDADAATRGIAARTKVIADPTVPPSGARLEVRLGDTTLVDAIEAAPDTHGLTWDGAVDLSVERAREAGMPLSAGRALAAAVRQLPTANRIDDLLHAAGYAR